MRNRRYGIESLRARLRQSKAGLDDQHGVAADAIADPIPDQGAETQESSRAADRDPTRSDARWRGLQVELGLPAAVVRTAAWAAVLLVVVAAAGQVIALLGFFSEVTVPLAVSLLTTALAAPAVDGLKRLGLPRALGAFVVVLGGLLAVGGLVALIGQQVAGQFDALSGDVLEGIDQVDDWLRNGPLDLSNAELTQAVDGIQSAVGGGDGVVSRAAAVGTSVTRFVTGLFIVVFATFFFCAQGQTIWHWFVRLFPAAARDGLDTSGRIAWVSLTAFVRATVLVALTDAVGIAIAVVVLQVPLALPLAVVVFLGAFVPIIGAAVSGGVAVLVALVAQGPWVALLMLAAVVAVQQLESHVLQPFLMGRLVSVHPLGIILAIAVGLVAGGVVGALIAVPLVACASAVRAHWATRPAPGAT